MSPQEALRRMRAEVGLTQIELAERLNIGFVTLNRWENGKSFPNRANAQNIIRTAKDMGVTTDCLLYLKDVLLPSRMRGRPAIELGFPALDQELLCQMVDDSTAGIILIDAATKRLVYVNRRAEELAGVKLMDSNDQHCWSYLRGLTEPCAGCEEARFPREGFCERLDMTRDGRRLKNRTKSVIWKGKTVYVLYMLDETELMESENETQLLTSLFPAGAGIFHLYKDGRLELLDAFYHDLGSRGDMTVQYTGPQTLDAILGEDADMLVNETLAALAENRDISVIFRMADSGRWMQLYARLFAEDEEKWSFYCSFVDMDRHMKKSWRQGGKVSRKQEN